jgi:hypothetical protein
MSRQERGGRVRVSEVDVREVCGTADRRGAKMFASERGDEGDEQMREACECECE